MIDQLWELLQNWNYLISNDLFFLINPYVLQQKCLISLFKHDKDEMKENLERMAQIIEIGDTKLPRNICPKLSPNNFTDLPFSQVRRWNT